METFYGNFKKTLFRDANSGMSYFIITSGVSEIVCRFNIPHLPNGFPVMVSGDFVLNEDKETCLYVKDFELTATKETTCKFIESGVIKGLKSVEKKILSLGDDCVASAARDDILVFAESLCEDNQKKFVDFFNIINEITTIHKMYLYIKNFDGTYHQAEKLCEQGNISVSEFKKNIYSIGEQANLPFHLCDKAFKSEGGFAYDKKRLIALCTAAVSNIVQCGHTFCTLDNLPLAITRIVKHSSFPDAEITKSMILQAVFYAPRLVSEKDDVLKIYRKDLYFQEKSITANLLRISDNQICFFNNKQDFETAKKQVVLNAKQNGITYSEKQLKAFDFLKSSGVKILTGGPGTGKTTVINGIIKLYKKLFPQKEILLCAPTGRASQKLAETTGLPSFTLHRALNVKPYKDTYTSKDETDPLAEDLIIVDEMSMTDTAIFSILLNAVKSSSILILCGDYDQLPSVGAGNILHDLIKCKKFETNRLDIIFRQANESAIVKNAVYVNAGKSQLVNAPDFRIMECQTEEEAELAVKRIAEHYYDKNNPFSFQVISSTKKGLMGIQSLNSMLKKVCNDEKSVVTFGSNSFSIGDKIIMNKNNYTLGYVNGDVGLIKKASANNITLDIKGTGDITVDDTAFSDISFGFAITVHKSQGTEYDTVVIVLPSNPIILLKRNLLYTAITRAKKRVILVTQPEVIQKTVSTLDTKLRNTGLCRKILNGVPKIYFNWGENYV